MKKKEILELFYKEMNPYFEEWGFKFSKTQLKATKKEGLIKKMIFFDANYFLGKGAFQPYLRVRSEEYMNLRSKINPRYDNNYFVTINMHLPEVASLFKREELNYLFQNLGEHDLGSYVYDETMPFYKEHFVKFMEGVGLRFFERFYTHKDFDHWFNDGLFEGKYEGVKIKQDTVPIYSYISAYISANECVEDIYNYWINYEHLYSEAKEEITLVREYLQNDYEAKENF